VDHEHVDPVGAEVLEALVDRGQHPFTAAVTEVRFVAVVHAELGDDDGFLSAPPERLSEGSFRRAHPVALGGVEAVDAEIEGSADGTGELRLVDLAVAAADLPATEPDGRDLESRLSEGPVLHGVPPRPVGGRELTSVSQRP
jgi:hypothetical protein